jgi:hypothetical protein
VRERRGVRELNDKEKKKTKKTLDTAGVVRDGRLCRYVTVAHHRYGDRAALAYAFVTFALKPVGTIEQMKMAAVSRLTNFSFDWYPLFTPVSKKSHPSCTTRATTAGSSKS